jgi:hypothetical protein
MGREPRALALAIGPALILGLPYTAAPQAFKVSECPSATNRVLGRGEMLFLRRLTLNLRTSASWVGWRRFGLAVVRRAG